MARDHSPIVKQSRREGYALAPKAHKVMAKKSGIPGEHSDMRVRGGSLYLTQLREKQKVRRTYGLLEKQFAKLMKEAQKSDGLTGEISDEQLCEFLEDNCDNDSEAITAKLIKKATDGRCIDNLSVIVCKLK